MPVVLRAVAAAMPLTYASRALREVVIRGGGLDRIGAELLILAGFAVVALAASALTLRRGAGA